MAPPSPATDGPFSIIVRQGAPALAAGLLWAFFDSGLLYLTVLKETPSFWLEASGHSAELRRFILDDYYALLVMGLLGQAVTVAFFLAAFMQRRRFFGACGLLALVPATGLQLATIVVLVANNVVNLLSGRGLHDH